MLLRQNRQLATQLAAISARPDMRTATAAARDNASANALLQLLEEKDAAYSALRAETDRLRQLLEAESTATTPRTLPAPNPAGSTTTNPPLAWMERLRQTDPQRYQQMVEQREQRRRQLEEWYQEQVARLDQRAQTAASAAEVDVATQIAEALTRLQELRDRWSAIRDLPEEQRRAAAEELQAETRTLYRALGELRELDRKIQLENLARGVGYSNPSDVQKFVDTVTAIYKNTEYSPPRPTAGENRGGGRSGPPPPPPPAP